MTDPAPLRPEVTAVSARPPLLDELTPCEEGARIIVFECLAHVSANVDPVLSGGSPEALHQMRVGLRRLRVALENFSTSEPAAVELLERGRALTNGLGPARDLDVFLDELFEPAVERLGAFEGFDRLRTRAAAARQRAWHAVIDEISSPGFAAFHEDAARWAKTLTWRGSVALAEVAPELLDRHLARCRKRGKKLALKDAVGRHRLRIALKKLRYSSEFFAPLYRPKKVEEFIELLKELQDMLGHLNDAAQARVVLGRLMMEQTATAGEQADLSHVTGLLQGFHQARADFVAEKALKRWKEFKKAAPFWQ